MDSTEDSDQREGQKPDFPGDQSAAPARYDLATSFLGGLFCLAAIAALQAASAILAPVVFAFIFNLLLQSPMRLLDRLYVPRMIGAVLAIGLVMGSLVGVGAALSGPAASWTQKLPAGIPRLQEHLSFLSAPLGALERFLHEAERVAEGQASGAPSRVSAGSGFLNKLVFGTRDIADGVFTMVIVLFFLLASGDTFLRRLVEVLPHFSDKRRAVEISQRIENDISMYLLTITMMNMLVGLATGAAAYFCGLGDPLLWGSVAFLLNYVPYLGPLVGIAIFVLAGLLSFDLFWRALLPAALYFGIHLIEGETLTPMLLARRFTLNPVLVVLALIFWYWMWGVLGAILAVPMLAIAKIIFDRIQSLKPLGHFLEA
ncbi:AI-2E family transporter [Methylocella silvestris]|uniref:AI-2E family transporter n=1 Tax=Methylocella silvestris TaxID=199596 RepID=A0A2J7TBW1_METSI|nr:AI-2E family transporter [Methylocella silvestris]PNG24253.1 AI-2E family transporter [Methylocella silvestris]